MDIILPLNALNAGARGQKIFESESEFNIYRKKSIKKMNSYIILIDISNYYIALQIFRRLFG